MFDNSYDKCAAITPTGVGLPVQESHLVHSLDMRSNYYLRLTITGAGVEPAR